MELSRKGDKARAAGRLSEAVEAYSDALQIRDDARIRGRLGLIALEGGAIAEAVQHLFLAFIDGHDIPPSERRQIVAAFERARPQVCRLDITVSHLGAEVWIDGDFEPASIGRNDFYVFVKPGRHEIRARLSGFKDAVQTVDAPKGGRETVPLLELQPIPPPSSPPTSASSPTPSSSTAPPSAPAMRAAAIPQSATPSRSPNSRSQVSPPRRWTPFVGTTVLYSALSPLPAMGLVASSEWPVGEVVSWRLDVRGAFSPRDKSTAVSGALIGVWPGVCGTVRWFSGCLLASGGALNRSRVTPRTPPFSEWYRFGGLGAGGIAAMPLGPLKLRIALDAVVLMDAYPLNIGGIRGARTAWSSSQIMAGLSVMAAIR
ncbi:tetratricopeptide repeat protein [Polyangium sp. y55x31]|uniref:tetratricopeptide repeat protein n=1 Tax=Polyangium sp. y55x31 TaxID=3042688 RepID=UPI002482E781|nr:tetratricopeptide repeat protein [Polyangium sp. y55x31]MDI1484639.1 tetratricopeptide repeat protein [Polyangium sp. y55x31]